MSRAKLSRLAVGAAFAALSFSCRGFDRRLVADAAASRIYAACRYELLCIQDQTKWECKIAPPAVRPVPVPGQCTTLFKAEEELRWQVQVAEKARQDEGLLPGIARRAIKAAKKAVDGLR